MPAGSPGEANTAPKRGARRMGGVRRVRGWSWGRSQRTVVHVAESDKIGGAARAMYSIHEALDGLGWTSRAVVGRKASFDSNVLTYRSPTGRALSLVGKFVDQQAASCRAPHHRTDHAEPARIAARQARQHPQSGHRPPALGGQQLHHSARHCSASRSDSMDPLGHVAVHRRLPLQLGVRTSCGDVRRLPDRGQQALVGCDQDRDAAQASRVAAKEVPRGRCQQLAGGSGSPQRALRSIER